ncbi:type II toxin-antitoxin system HicB family antitoxin [Bifidobacterium canis]|uniref:type II toxin-antitoxin system HicB family antitoxin n=1 Tax=Bifidobacterium canis TaxID=2610880 RepID=UPI001B354581
MAYSPEDEQFVGTVLEFSSLSWLDDSPVAALNGIQKVVDEAIDILRADGQEVPQPFSARHYSGKFTVRIPPATHRRLAIEAQEQHISFNRLISEKLNAA